MTEAEHLLKGLIDRARLRETETRLERLQAQSGGRAVVLVEYLKGVEDEAYTNLMDLENLWDRIHDKEQE